LGLTTPTARAATQTLQRKQKIFSTVAKSLKVQGEQNLHVASALIVSWEQQIWNECSRLIANAIIYYNTLLLSRVYEQKVAAGDLELSTGLQ
jgi:hypothetical protein